MNVHEMLVTFLFVMMGLILCKLVGAWIEESVRWKFRQRHGNECDCDAMRDLPVIMEKQRQRDTCMMNINTQLVEHSTVLKRLDNNVDKLFTLFEEEWKDEIKALKVRKDDKELH